MMRINDAGLAIIKRYEGCQLSAYRCPAGIPSIGFGHTKGVKMGDKISQGEADELLLEDIEGTEDELNRLLQGVKTNVNQFSAFVSFAFNLGVPALKGSTLLKRHLAGDISGAANEFLRWNRARVKGVLMVLPGLTKRRAAERALYLEKVA